METGLIVVQDAARPVVSLVTALAETGDLSADEYRGIYDRVAAGRSLRNSSRIPSASKVRPARPSQWAARREDCCHL